MAEATGIRGELHRSGSEVAAEYAACRLRPGSSVPGGSRGQAVASRVAWRTAGTCGELVNAGGSRGAALSGTAPGPAAHRCGAARYWQGAGTHMADRL